MSASYRKSGPGLKQLSEQIRQIKGNDVLIGIPSEKAPRENERINNASLLYLHTHGSPLQNIPPRPVLEPSIEANGKLITPHLAAAAQSVLNNQPEHASEELERAGVVASNGAKRWFTNPENGWAPNAPSTIARKGSDQPLIDQGELRRAITYAVRKSGQQPTFVSHKQEHSIQGAPVHAPAFEPQSTPNAQSEPVLSETAEALEEIPEAL